MEHQEIKEKYLSNKRTLLSVPGTLKTDAYVSVNDSSVHLVELTANLGRYTSSLSTNQFAGVGQVLVPNQDILGNTFLHLELPSRGDKSQSWMAPQGWGWTAIKSVSYLWGSSNVSQISLSGKSLWAIAMAQCDTAEKRSQLCYLGGTLTPSPGGASTAGLDSESIGNHAYIPLALPWSVMCKGGKIGFDTGLINSPITIQIQFANADEFLCWGEIRDNTVAPLPTAFASAEIVIRQQMFTNRAQSLKFEMQADPDAVYNYPFTHYQSAQFDFVAPVGGGDCDVQLTNFINADLLGMVVYMVEKDKLAGGAKPVSTTASNLNPTDITLPSDVRLLYNGQVLYNSPGKLYLLQNCANLVGSGSYYSTKQDVVVAGTTGAITTTNALPIVKDLLFIDFSRKHSPCFEKEYPNTFRIANQVLSLKFKMPAGSNASTKTDYTLFATYIFNGVNSVQQGASNLYFD